MKIFVSTLLFILLSSTIWSQKDVLQNLYRKAPEIKTDHFDSTFVTSIIDRDTIEYTDVNALFQNEVKDTSEYSGKWLLMAINEMDSLKAEGDFQSYLDRLDIGMLAKAEIYLVGKIELKKNLNIIAWGVNYSTVEACPYGYGAHLFFTLIDKDFNILNCVLAAEYSGGGDPPIFGSTERQAQLNTKQLTLEIHVINIEGEMGDEGEIIDKKEKDFSYRFTTEGIQ